MKILGKRYWFYGLFIGVVLLGFMLRFHNYTVWPRLGATFDEYAWTWQGMNIIQHGVPISWSPHPQYTDSRNIIYQKTHFRIVKPFLEHPPVFGIVAGGFALIAGANDMYDLNIAQIRPLALILGTISILLIYLLTRDIYDRRTAIIATILYATVPTIVIGSRIVQNENFLIPCFLLTLYLASKYIRSKKQRYRNLVLFLCFSLVLAKIPWIAVGISIFGIFLFYKKYTDALLVLASVVGGLAAFAVYGYYYDWNLFINLWKLQADRYDLAFSSIFALFQKPFLVDRYYTDGWIYLGWFAFVLLLIKDIKKNIFVVAPVLSYFLIFMAGIPDEAGHGWYRYPFYPFLIVSTALFMREYFAKNFLLTFFFLALVGASLLDLTWEKTFGFSVVVLRTCLITWSLVLIPYFPIFKKRVKFARVLSYSWLAIFILLNIWAALLYNEQ